MSKQFYLKVAAIFLTLFFTHSLTTFAATFNVSYTSSGFSPATVTITSGDTVRWTNSSSASLELASDPHPQHTNYPALNLGLVNPGSSISLTFNTAGSYGYHNHLNASLTGRVVVQSPSSPVASPISSPATTVVNPTPTSSSLPETGSLLPTVFLSSLGLIFTFFGAVLLLKKKLQ